MEFCFALPNNLVKRKTGEKQRRGVKSVQKTSIETLLHALRRLFIGGASSSNGAPELPG